MFVQWAYLMQSIRQEIEKVSKKLPFGSMTPVAVAKERLLCPSDISKNISIFRLRLSSERD